MTDNLATLAKKKKLYLENVVKLNAANVEYNITRRLFLRRRKKKKKKKNETKTNSSPSYVSLVPNDELVLFYYTPLY